MNTANPTKRNETKSTAPSMEDTALCQDCTRADKIIELESMVRYLAKELNVDLSDLLNEGGANKSSQL